MKSNREKIVAGLREAIAFAKGETEACVTEYRHPTLARKPLSLEQARKRREFMEAHDEWMAMARQADSIGQHDHAALYRQHAKGLREQAEGIR